MDPGTVFAENYLVEQLLGSGGFANIYLATELELERQVALKVMLPDADSPGEPYEVLKERFFREARTLSQLREPQTIRLYDYGEAEGPRLYMALEYVDGRDLRTLLDEEGAQPPKRTAEIIRQVLLGLREVHSLGVLHRDIKPGNIMVYERFGELKAKLLDFGIAKSLSPTSEDLTQVGWVVGTPRYLAPEQIMGADLSAATDIYSTGLLLYELALGKAPFEDCDVQEILGQEVDYREMIDTEEELVDPLRSFLYRCLTREPGDRFQSAQQAIDELNRRRPLLERLEARQNPSPAQTEKTRPVPLQYAEDTDTTVEDWVDEATLELTEPQPEASSADRTSEEWPTGGSTPPPTDVDPAAS